MNSAALLNRLWQASDKAELLNILSEIPHITKPIGKRSNNIHAIQLSISPYAAITEGVTNAHDAVIMDWIKTGRITGEPTVAEALSHIAENSDPLVHIFHKKISRGAATVTLIDQGCGMTQEKMFNGVLDIGSPDKSIQKWQHGNFGQGGATLYGRCNFSVVVSRTRDSDDYLFTVVYKETSDDETVAESYVYACHPNGDLFRVSAAGLSYTKPGKHTKDWKANAENKLILPEHGTVRRHVGMEVEWWETGRPSLYTSLSDNMFGSPGVVRMVGETNAHQNQRRGRRHDWNAVPVGGKLNHRSNAPEMLCKIPEKKVRIFKERNVAFGDVGISVWVIDEWKSEKDGKRKSPVFHLLDGHASGGARGIIITYNGQQHARLLSKTILRQAGVDDLSSMMVIEVAMDSLTRSQRNEAMLPDRSHLDEKFERKLGDAIGEYLKAHEDLLLPIIRRMDSTVESVPSKDIQKIANELLNNPILGAFAGLDTLGAKGAKLGGKSNKPGETEVGKLEKDENEKPVFVPSDPPTYIMISRSKVKRDVTEWITVCTDAPDHYGERFNVKLPDILTSVPGDVKLHNGRITFPVVVSPEAKIGDEGKMVVALKLDDGTMLRTERTITVVPITEKPEKKPNIDSTDKNGENSASFPEIKIVEIDGVEDSRFMGTFGPIEETEAAFGFKQVEDGKLHVIVNRKFGMNELVSNHLKKQYRAESDVMMANFREEMTKAYMTASAILFTTNALDGLQDTDAARILAQMTRSAAVSITQRYQDREYRRVLKMHSKVAAE